MKMDDLRVRDATSHFVQFWADILNFDFCQYNTELIPELLFFTLILLLLF